MDIYFAIQLIDCLICWNFCLLIQYLIHIGLIYPHKPLSLHFKEVLFELKKYLINTLPIPSVQPVTTAHFPYFLKSIYLVSLVNVSKLFIAECTKFHVV